MSPYNCHVATTNCTILKSTQRHYIRKVSGLQMSRSLEIHSTDSSLYYNTRTTLRTVSGGGTCSSIQTVNYLEPHTSYVLQSQTFKWTSPTKFTRIFDLGLTLGLSRRVDKGLIPTKGPLANLLCPQSPPFQPNNCNQISLC